MVLSIGFSVRDRIQHLVVVEPVQNSSICRETFNQNVKNTESACYMQAHIQQSGIPAGVVKGRRGGGCSGDRTPERMVPALRRAECPAGFRVKYDQFGGSIEKIKAKKWTGHSLLPGRAVINGTQVWRLCSKKRVPHLFRLSGSGSWIAIRVKGFRAKYSPSQD